MFGMTSQQILNSAGPGGESQAFDYTNPLESISSAYKNEDLGESAFGISQDLSDQVSARDKQFTQATGISALRHSYTFPEVSDAMKDQTIQPSDAAINYYRSFSPNIISFGGQFSTESMASHALKTQVAWEKQIQQYNQAHGTNYATFDQMVPQTQQRVLQAQKDEQTAEQRSPGFWGGFLPRLVGGAGASVSLNNAPNLAMMVGLSMGGEPVAAKGLLPVLGRYATAGLTNMAMAAANAFGFTQSQRAGVGVPLTTKEISGRLPGQFVGAAAFHGVNEISGAIGKYFFPSKSLDAVAPVMDNLKQASQDQTPVGELARQLQTAETPDHAAHIANSARTEDVADLYNRIDTNQTDGTRAIMQAVEPEINLEKTRQPGVTYEEHAQNLVDTVTNVNQEKTLPFNNTDTDAKLPLSLARAAPRYGTSQISFDSDIDRALYIVRPESKNVSASHDDYMNFLRQAGLTDQQIRDGSVQVSTAIKSAARGAEKGDNLTVSKTFNPDKTRGNVSQQAVNDYIDRYLSNKGISNLEARGPSMLQFLAKNGGLRPDEGGELAAMNAEKWIGLTKQLPGTNGLIKENGMSLDDAGQLLHQHGYFPENAGRPAVNDVIEAISNELHGNNRFSERFESHELIAQQAALEQLDQAVNEAGLDTKGMSRSDLISALEKNARTQQETQQQGLDSLSRQWDTEVPQTNKAEEFDRMVQQSPTVDDLLEKLSMYDPESLVALGGENGDVANIREVLEQIKDDENLHSAMTSCLVG